MKNNLKKDILELFCGLENGEIDCNTETEIKLDKILENHTKKQQKLLDIFTYENDGRIYTSLIGDSDVTDLLTNE